MTATADAFRAYREDIATAEAARMDAISKASQEYRRRLDQINMAYDQAHRAAGYNYQFRLRCAALDAERKAANAAGGWINLAATGTGRKSATGTGTAEIPLDEKDTPYHRQLDRWETLRSEREIKR